MRKGGFEKGLETVTVFGPGPFIVMFLSITSSALVNVMICPLRAAAKLMRLRSCASARTWRSEPGPLSLVLVTLMGCIGRGGGGGRGLL